MYTRCLNGMSGDEMFAYEMSVDKMTVDKIKCCLNLEF